jgi:hypothetical protein
VPRETLIQIAKANPVMKTGSSYATFLSAIALLSIHVPANAAHWVMVAREGAQPNRNVHYLALDEVSSSLDLENFDQGKALAMKAADMAKYMEASQIKTAFVVQVMEGTSDPDTIQYTVEIKCVSKQFRITNAFALYRNNETEKMNSLQWAAIPDNWIGRVYTVACEMEDKVAPAIQKFYDASKRIQKNPNASMNDKAEAMLPLAQLGLIYATEIPLIDYIKLSDFSWKHLWQDGTRPAYTTTKSREEILQEREELNRKVAELDVKTQQFEQQIKGIEAERVFMEKVAANFSKKDGEQRKHLFSLQGWTEKEIVDFWGVPNSERELAGTKALDYRSVIDTRQTVVDNVPVLDAKGATVGMNSVEREIGELSQCDLTLFMEPGGSKPGYRLVDYRINGTNCRWSTLGQLVR